LLKVDGDDMKMKWWRRRWRKPNVWIKTNGKDQNV